MASDIDGGAIHRGPEGNRPMTTRARAVAILGTGSNVGKSVITAGLCRLLVRAGRKVAPFKAQNMSLNSFVTPEGGEIGRAQALQAQACNLPPHVDMNPILLKPESDQRAQVVVHGHVWNRLEAAQYLSETGDLFRFVEASYERLAASVDAIVIEGAGSAAEVNLWDRDIANWRVARLADAPVVLVADIDVGGVFAQIVGTLELLHREERARVMGIIVNKFRGDRSVFSDGMAFLEKRTGVPILGVVPFVHDLRLDEEDSLQPGRHSADRFSNDRINIAVVLLPRMSNFTDFKHVAEEGDVALVYAARPDQLYGADVIIIPGSKNSIADLHYIRTSGIGPALDEHVRRGGELIGICGGYQMLGRDIRDPCGMEAGGSAQGLGLLDVTTELTAVKKTHEVKALPMHVPIRSSAPLTGYYIHLGRTERRSGAAYFRIVASQTDAAGLDMEEGALRADGRVWGTYIHGVFDHAGFRRAWLNTVRGRKGLHPLPESTSEDVNERLRLELDRWADHLHTHLNLISIFQALQWYGDVARRGASRCD